MRKLKELLRLHSLGLSQHQIARSCCISQSTVHEYVSAAQAAGVRWPLPDNWEEQQLEDPIHFSEASDAGVPVFVTLADHSARVDPVQNIEYVRGHPPCQSAGQDDRFVDCTRQCAQSVPLCRVGSFRFVNFIRDPKFEEMRQVAANELDRSVAPDS